MPGRGMRVTSECWSGIVIRAVKDVVKRELEKCVPENMRKVLFIA